MDFAATTEVPYLNHGNHQGNFNQQPMFDVMKPSLSYYSFRPKSNMTVTDVSLSSYLPPDEPNRTVADDSELSIFDARKYFNENNDQIVSNGNNRVSLVKECYSNFPGNPRLSSASSSIEGCGRNFRVRSFHSYATPTASSEASWNSHTGLLSNPPGAVAVTLREPTTERKTGCSSPRWLLLRRKCACLGKKSVQIKEKSEKRTPTHLKLHDSKSKELLNSKMHVDIAAPGKAGSTASADSGVLKVVANPSRYHEHKLKEMFPQRRFSSSEAEKNFQPHQDARRMSLSVLASRRPFIDANTAGFTFPILNPTLPSLSSSSMEGVLDGPASRPRDSLEVFQPPGSQLSRKSREINEHQSPQLRVMSSGLPPRDHRAFALPPSPKPRLSTAVIDDEAASDASSDLFEIESFSTQTTSYPGYNRHRDSLDEARPRFSTNTGLYNCLDDQPMTPTSPTECGYEPSEASISWSVTTAEGTQFDRARLTNYSISASDVEEFTKMQLKLHHELEKNSSRDSGGTGGSKKRGNGLLSCRCEKAVSVGPNPVKWVPEMGPGPGQGHKKCPSPSPPAATSLTRHVSSRPPTRHKPPLASSHSARLSLTFAT